MTDLVAVAAVLPAAVGACCSAGGRRRPLDRALSIALAGTSALAMTDSMLGVHLVSSLVWSLLLVTVALLAGLRLRLRRSPAPAASSLSRSPRSTDLHAVTGAILMAGLLLVAPHTETGPGASSAHEHGSSLATLLAAGVIAYAAITLVVVGRLLRARARLAAVESCTMALSAVLMLSVHL